jgi:hypothetical protein
MIIDTINTWFYPEQDRPIVEMKLNEDDDGNIEADTADTQRKREEPPRPWMQQRTIRSTENFPLQQPQSSSPKTEQVKRSSLQPKNDMWETPSLEVVRLSNGWAADWQGKPTTDPKDIERLNQIKAEFLHCWNNYKLYAWGRDELRPKSKRGFDWMNMGLTIVDSLDTLLIMNLTSEFEEAREWVATNLTFSTVFTPVSVFEVTIRILGGLLSTYEMTFDPLFLSKSQQLAEILLNAFANRKSRWNLRLPKSVPYN